jgi:hypothetical protein
MGVKRMKSGTGRLSLIAVSLVLALPMLGCGPQISPAARKSVTLAWAAPAENDDGSALTDLRGYRVKYGTAPGDHETSVDVGNVTRHTIQDLDPDKTYYFIVCAVNVYGDEGPASNEMRK